MVGPGPGSRGRFDELKMKYDITELVYGYGSPALRRTFWADREERSAGVRRQRLGRAAHHIQLGNSRKVLKVWYLVRSAAMRDAFMGEPELALVGVGLW